MGAPAAKLGDQVIAVDTHIVIVPGVGPTPLPHPFAGQLMDSLSQNVLIMGQPAATVGSIARNLPPHIPTSPGTSFSSRPANQGTVVAGSRTVLINGKSAARAGDTVSTCNDPADLPAGSIVAAGTVLIG
jgi:uncharacterized Zn-binding protein involved in type VI secretion